MTPLPLESAFDLIIIADTLYYVNPRTPVALNTLARAFASKLTPGGLILIANHYFFGVDPASRETREIHDASSAGRRASTALPNSGAPSFWPRFCNEPRLTISSCRTLPSREHPPT